MTPDFDPRHDTPLTGEPKRQCIHCRKQRLLSEFRIPRWPPEGRSPVCNRCHATKKERRAIRRANTPVIVEGKP
jgi:hypothetical protein